MEGRDSSFLFSVAGMNQEEGGAISYFSFSFSFSGLNNRKIVVLTLLEKEKTRTLISQQSHSFVMALSFSPDGRFLATTSGFGELIIWATEVNKKTEQGNGSSDI